MSQSTAPGNGQAIKIMLGAAGTIAVIAVGSWATMVTGRVDTLDGFQARQGERIAAMESTLREVQGRVERIDQKVDLLLRR